MYVHNCKYFTYPHIYSPVIKWNDTQSTVPSKSSLQLGTVVVSQVPRANPDGYSNYINSTVFSIKNCLCCWWNAVRLHFGPFQVMFQPASLKEEWLLRMEVHEGWATRTQIVPWLPWRQRWNEEFRQWAMSIMRLSMRFFDPRVQLNKKATYMATLW